MSYSFNIPYKRVATDQRGDFSRSVRYVPIIDTTLEYNKKRLQGTFDSVVDSGADYCVFPAEYGVSIGVDIEKGKRLPTHGVGGREILYFHTIRGIVNIEGEFFQFKCFAGFSRKMNQRGVGLLWRKGFFNLFSKVTFNEDKRNLHLVGEGSKPNEFKLGGPLF